MPGVLSPRRGLLLATLLALSAPVATPARAAPSAQTTAGFELVAAPVGNASAALRWSAVSDAASYTIYGARTVAVDPVVVDPQAPEAQASSHPLARATAGTFVEIAKGLRDTAATLVDLPREGTYALVVRAVDQNGREYAQSAPATVELHGAPGDDLTVEMPTWTAVRLAWEAVPGATRYALLSGPLGRPLAPDRARPTLNTTSTVIDGLPASSTWRFSVVAQDSDGRVLAQTRVEEVTTAPPSPPPGLLGMR